MFVSLVCVRDGEGIFKKLGLAVIEDTEVGNKCWQNHEVEGWEGITGEGREDE